MVQLGVRTYMIHTHTYIYCEFVLFSQSKLQVHKYSDNDYEEYYALSNFLLLLYLNKVTYK